MKEENKKHEDYFTAIWQERVEKLKAVGFTEDQANVLIEMIKNISFMGGMF